MNFSTLQPMIAESMRTAIWVKADVTEHDQQVLRNEHRCVWFCAFAGVHAASLHTSSAKTKKCCCRADAPRDVGSSLPGATSAGARHGARPLPGGSTRQIPPGRR